MTLMINSKYDPMFDDPFYIDFWYISYENSGFAIENFLQVEDDLNNGWMTSHGRQKKRHHEFVRKMNNEL